MMKIGFDYWNVCSAHPEHFAQLAGMYLRNYRVVFGKNHDEVHIVSAIGKSRLGTVKAEVDRLMIPYTAVHEVVFSHPRESPELKTAFCLDNGITVFYDDRQDVVDAMTEAGILAFRVPRMGSTTDINAERS
jgi:acid phosphatase class B